MHYRMLGNTGLKVSTIGIGSEALLGRSRQEAGRLSALMQLMGVNVVDIGNPEPSALKALGYLMKGHRRQFIVQADIGSVLQDGVTEYTTDPMQAAEAFNQELILSGTDHFEIGVISGVQSVKDLETVTKSGLLDYAEGIREAGVIRHIGLATNDLKAASEAVASGRIEVLTLEEPAVAGEKVEEVPDEVKEVAARCGSAGIGITVRMPYEPDPAHKSEDALAKDLKRRVSKLLHIPAASSVIAGVHSQPELLELLKYAD